MPTARPSESLLLYNRVTKAGSQRGRKKAVNDDNSDDNNNNKKKKKDATDIQKKKKDERHIRIPVDEPYIELDEF